MGVLDLDICKKIFVCYLIFVHVLNKNEIILKSSFCLKAMEQQEAANKQMDPPADGKQPWSVNIKHLPVELKQKR